jgi:AcrR family transcriptional regulator
MYSDLPTVTETKTEDRALPTGTRAKSKERNRQKILESAMNLFRERGFEAATLRDIAKDAGLSTGALFANFNDKNEIFVTVVEAENARVIDVMRDSYDESLDLVARLHKQLMQGYEAAQANARLILSAFVMKWSAGQSTLNDIARLSDQVRETLLHTLKAAQARKELPEGAKIEDAAEILEDLVFANMRRAFQNSTTPGFELQQLADRLSVQIGLLVAGLKAA